MISWQDAQYGNVCVCPEFLIYDDGCHLKKYATNPERLTKTPTAQRIGSVNIVVDRFHFPGHVDPWCKEHCNPNKFDALKEASVKKLWRVTKSFYYVQVSASVNNVYIYVLVYKDSTICSLWYSFDWATCTSLMMYGLALQSGCAIILHCLVHVKFSYWCSESWVILLSRELC